MNTAETGICLSLCVRQHVEQRVEVQWFITQYIRVKVERYAFKPALKACAKMRAHGNLPLHGFRRYNGCPLLLLRGDQRYRLWRHWPFRKETRYMRSPFGDGVRRKRYSRSRLGRFQLRTKWRFRCVCPGPRRLLCLSGLCNRWRQLICVFGDDHLKNCSFRW